MQLNRRAAELCDSIEREAELLRVRVTRCASGARLIDCGVETRGGLEAGLRLAEVCLAGLGGVRLLPADPELCGGGLVEVCSDHPVAACMAAQYAGWEVKGGDFFAMGSGPMRAAAGREELFDRIGHRETSDVAVGALESGSLPPPEICRELAEKCGVAPDRLTLLVAPTRSQAGTLQVVARSLETALHKLDELGFDLARVESGLGTAPLPPVAADDLTGIGRTNDAILYGGDVTLHLRGDDASLQEIGPRVPSCASPDHGEPFAAIFARYDNDFYRIDPHLFSPAIVTLANLDTGNTFRFGHKVPRVLHEAFGRK